MNVNILYQCSDLYAPIAGTAITSVLVNNQHFDTINFYILDDGISEQNKQKMISICDQYKRNIEFLNTQIILDILEPLNAPKWRNTYTIYFKLFVSKLLPDSVDKILYLDSDTMVHGAIDDLAQTDLTDSPCAMVVSPNYNGHKETIGMSTNSLYFEAGTIYFNLDYFRKNNCISDIIGIMTSPDSRYFAADQDILNILYSDKIVKLALKFGVCTGIYLFSTKQIYTIYQLNAETFYPASEIEEAKANPVICHFAGGGFTGRPWEKDNIDCMSSKWNDYRAISPWHDYRMPDKKWTSISKIQYALYKILPEFFYALIHRQVLRLHLKRNVKISTKERQNA